MEKEVTKGLIEQSGEVLCKAYDDIIHPTAEPTGQILSYLPRAIRLCFARFEKWLINGEENLRLTSEALKDKVSKIPEEKLCEPEPFVAVPAMQQLAYCYDSDELRNLYANLLASSMNDEKKWQVHPGYVDIIKQLTPDEAKLLPLLPKQANAYIPIVDLKVKMGSFEEGEHLIKQNYTNLGDAVCENPENICLYIDDLARLRIIDIPSSCQLVDKTQYESIKNSEYICKLKSSIQLGPEQEYAFNEKVLGVTEFGIGFLRCCTDEEEPIELELDRKNNEEG